MLDNFMASRPLLCKGVMSDTIPAAPDNSQRSLRRVTHLGTNTKKPGQEKGGYETYGRQEVVGSYEVGPILMLDWVAAA